MTHFDSPTSLGRGAETCTGTPSSTGDGRREAGHAELYAAELAAFDGTSFESAVPFEQLERLALKILAAPWWPGLDVAVVPARSDARKSTTNWKPDTTTVIRIAREQQTAATIAHEFAHLLAGPRCGHGPNFRRAYLDIVGYALGAEQQRWLEDAFADARLAVGDRTWPEPTSVSLTSGPIAL